MKGDWSVEVVFFGASILAILGFIVTVGLLILAIKYVWGAIL